MDDSAHNMSLAPSRSDYVATVAKAILGTVPFVGSLLTEIAGSIIPNQRIDRVAKFAETLEEKLRHLEKEMLQSQAQDEHFTDLIEEGLRQATRSLSDERREYIAQLIANSLDEESIAYQESKHLLRILGEINDVEVIWLRSYLVRTIGGDGAFRTQHEAILNPARVHSGADQKVRDEAALQASYKQHLLQLGLLEAEYEKDNKTKQPKFDSSTGGLQLRGYRLTSLGRLLLREIGLAGPDGDPISAPEQAL